MTTSGKHDPSLAQELEEERARLIEEAGKRGPRKPKTNGRTLTPIKKGARSHGKSEYARGKDMTERNAGAHALPGLVVKRNERAHTHANAYYIYRESKVWRKSTKVYRGWDIVFGLWAPPVFFGPITKGSRSSTGY